MNTKPRILFMGTNSLFSVSILQKLLDATPSICGLMLPTITENPIPYPQRSPTVPSNLEPIFLTERPLTIWQLAQASDIPIFEMSTLRSPKAYQILQTLAPELICVACFPMILPKSWLQYPPFGCLNLHPSLLPAYRGPTPLFWQLRAGERATGVTLHFMDIGIDTGDIVSQSNVSLPDGISYSDAIRKIAQIGGLLFQEALENLPDIQRTPQPGGDNPYQSYPTSKDKIISDTWPAQRALNFIQGAAPWGPFEIWSQKGVYKEVTTSALDLDTAPQDVSHRVLFSDRSLLVNGTWEPKSSKVLSQIT